VKILLDECIPRRLRNSLPGYDIKTVQESGWAGIKNGELLDKAAAKFDVFVTVDRNLSLMYYSRRAETSIIQLRSSSEVTGDAALNTTEVGNFTGDVFAQLSFPSFSIVPC